jgi:5-methylcytosine-specific restriction endonuclease McrA
MIKECSVCSVSFNTPSANKHTCSKNCYQKYWEKNKQSDDAKVKREIWKLDSARYGKLKKRVIDKGFSYVMDEKKYYEIIKGNCYYCDRVTWGIEKGVGLDRIDNDEEYLEENVVACCKDCNRSRGNMYTSDAFKGLMNSDKYIRALEIMNAAQKAKRTLEEFVDAILAKGENKS